MSFSRMSLFLECPKKFYWHYIERWKPAKDESHFILGKMVHDGLKGILSGESLDTVLAEAQKNDLSEYRDENEIRSTVSKAIKALHPIAATMTPVEDNDGKFIEREVREKGLVGIIDCFHVMADGRRQVMDWKTSSKPYGDHVAQLSGQLTMYQILLESKGQSVDSLAFGVVTKGHSPKIGFSEVPKRTEQEKKEFMDKVFWVSRSIQEGQFPKNEGWLCERCPYLSLCLGNKPTNLVQENF